MITNGIYWSKQLESQTPIGFNAIDDSRWSHLVNTSHVVKMVKGCGRVHNRLVTFSTGHMSCVRSRQNNDQIQGDIFSFYLSRLLAITNLPPATVALVKTKDSSYDNQWQNVRTELQSYNWDKKPVVLTQYVNDLVPAYIPQQLTTDNRRLHPVAEDIGGLNVSQLTELVQWSDLIVFDYLTANMDRLINNMVNHQWDQQIMQKPVHNLLKVKNSGLLLFIDNESGLLHGYRLINKYERQHRSVLSALCIFPIQEKHFRQKCLLCSTISSGEELQNIV
ncbi:four-jointed box protein 1-like [Oppia nitens]|uniref:four-jointed box protein 1-like n=1 Tax=Oppia nitens TaxID=1686743 RepID=UPI0023DA62DC|nr:four-jointed box protein 1-like [Oppia nitens]